MSPLMPALLNRMSSPPNRAAACCRAAMTCSSTVTSVTLKSATSGPSSATAASRRLRASPARCTLGPFGYEQPGAGQADAALAPSDQGDLAVQPGHDGSSTSLMTVPGVQRPD